MYIAGLTRHKTSRVGLARLPNLMENKCKIVGVGMAIPHSPSKNDTLGERNTIGDETGNKETCGMK